MKRKSFFTGLSIAIFVITLCCFISCSKRSMPDDGGKMILHSINGAEAATLDPTLREGSPGTSILGNIFEGLLRVDTSNGGYLPGVAEKWKVSPDGKTYTFFLRSNAKWTNGEAVTAQDFVYSYRRALDPKVASQNASLFFILENAPEVFKQEKTLESLGVKALDESTLELKLQNPAGYFFNLLTLVPFCPIPQETVEKYKDQWTKPENIVSNGPFKIVKRVLNDKTIAVKNPLYWGKDEVKLDQIIFYTTDDNNTKLRLFESNLADFHTRGIASSAYPQIKKHPEWRGYPYLSVYYYLFNTQKEPLNNPKFRQAISLALDRKSLTDKVLQVGYIPAYSLIPPEVRSYEPSALLTEDVKEAKRLLAEAGYPDPTKVRKLTVLYNTNERHRQVAQVIAHRLKTVLGLDIAIENAEWKTYLDRRRHGDYDIARAGWIGDFEDPSTFLDLVYTKSQYNDTGWSNAQYDTLFESIHNMTDAKERLHIQQRAEKIIVENLPLLPIYFYIADVMVKPYVKNLYPRNQDDIKNRKYDILSRDIFRDVYIDLEEKKKYWEQSN